MTYPAIENQYEAYIAENRARKILPYLEKSDDALDYGCGIGVPWKRGHAPCNIVAWDIDERALKEALSTGRYEKALGTFNEPFDALLLMGVLEHIVAPRIFLRDLIHRFTPKHIYITVPNGQSIHRRFGTEMGMLDFPNALTDADVDFDHYTCFTYNSLVSLVESIDNCFRIESGSSHFKVYNSIKMQDFMDEEEWRALDSATEGIVHGRGVYFGAELYMVLEVFND
jgi:hypothetical protein